MKTLIVSSATSGKDDTQAGLFYIATALDVLGIPFDVLDLSGSIDYFNPPNNLMSPINSDYWLSSRIFYDGLWMDKYLLGTYGDIDVIYYSALFSPDILIHGRHLVNQKKVKPDTIGIIGGVGVQDLNVRQREVLLDVFDKICTNGTFKKMSPNYSLIDTKLFATIYSGDGCHWGSCRFCRSGSASCFNRPLKEIAFDLKQLASLECKEVMLSSDTFTQLRLTELASVLKGNKTPYNIMLRGEKWVSDKLASSLDRSGCSDVFIGAESLSDAILRILNKGVAVEDIAYAVKNLARYMKVILGLILFVPGVKLKYLEDQLIALEKVVPYVSRFEPDILSVTYGAEFAANPKKYGIQLWTTPSINDAWCYGFSPDIPWLPIDRTEIDMWFAHCDKLQNLLGGLVHPRYWESVDAVKERF